MSFMFEVKLIKSASEQTKRGIKALHDNCTHVAGNVWIYEGDEEALEDYGTRFEVIDTGLVGSLGGLSQDELIELCKKTFTFDHAILN